MTMQNRGLGKHGWPCYANKTAMDPVTLTLEIEGMTDAARAEEAAEMLKSIPGISQVTIRREEDKADIQFDPESTDFAMIAEKLNGCGFTLQ